MIEQIEQHPIMYGLLAFYLFVLVIFIVYMMLWRDEIVEEWRNDWKDEFKDWEDE